MDESRCGHPTRTGGSCRWPRDECPHHRQTRQAPGPHAHDAPRRGDAAPTRPPERDLRELGWWLVDEVLAERVGREQASGVASVMRVLAGLGPAPDDTEAALAEVELRGRIAYGLAPRDAEEWALARERFTGEALQELARRANDTAHDTGNELDAPVITGHED